jgi:alginate O-acetyltransferase complex protein AlgI
MSIEALTILFGTLLVSWAARWISAPKARQWILLSASYFLYAHWAGKRFLLLLIASSLLNYLWGSVLRRRPTSGWLWSGIALNVLLLSFFKYLPPFFKEFPDIFVPLDFLSNIIMPVGISFWTFQGLSFLFDIYREEDIDPSLLEFCLFMAFWPTVFSGPVCRLPKILPQLRRRFNSEDEDFAVGTVRIIQGLFMKFVLAQLLSSGLTPGTGVAAGFDEIAPARTGLDVWVLALGYGFQIFFDFAGYSSIVIGAARILGFRIPENFNRPYLALTPSIFWTRWHMSLSFWIRDYVYMPLATLRRDPWWPYAAMVISMVIFGFWHDAKLTFVAWGVYHGILLVGHRIGQLAKRRISLSLPNRLGALLSWGTTFLLVSLSYIFFRANDLGQAFRMLRAVFAPRTYAFGYATLSHEYYLLISVVVAGYFIYVAAAELLLVGASYYRRKVSEGVQNLGGRVAPAASLTTVLRVIIRLLIEKKVWWLAPIYALLLMVTTLSFFGQSSNIAPFIYTLF